MMQLDSDSIAPTLDFDQLGGLAVLLKSCRSGPRFQLYLCPVLNDDLPRRLVRIESVGMVGGGIGADQNQAGESGYGKARAKTPSQPKQRTRTRGDPHNSADHNRILYFPESNGHRQSLSFAPRERSHPKRVQSPESESSIAHGEASGHRASLRFREVANRLKYEG